MVTKKATFEVGKPRHLDSRQVYREISAFYGRAEITDACAVTVASWWQSPGRTGLPFAELASTGHVDVERLHEAIAHAYTEADDLDKRVLDMLGTWALNHPARLT